MADITAAIVTRAALTAAAALIFAASSNAMAQSNRKIDNTGINKPAEDLAPTPGSKGSRTEALGAYMFVLPQMLKAIPGDTNPGAVFGGADKSSQSITLMLRQLLETQPQQKTALEGVLRKHGYFQSLDEWALTGDEFTLGMIAASMKRDNRSYYDRIFTLTPQELASMSDQLRPSFELMREFTDEENSYYDAYLDYYQEVLTPYAAQP